MGVEHPEALSFCCRYSIKPRQHRVLQDIGKIARVIDVAVIHDFVEVWMNFSMCGAATFGRHSGFEYRNP
jgi:hypothetical protein